MVPQDGQVTAGDDEARTLSLQRLITFRLSRLQSRLNAEAAKLLRDHGGLSLTQWRIFVMLEAHGELTAADIVRSSQIDKAQISRAARDMVNAGLLTQRDSPLDQRAHLLDFTEAGWAAFRRARPHMRARQARIIDALSDEELQVFFHVLDKIETVAGEDA